MLLANLLTVSRLPLAALFWVLPAEPWIFVVLLAVGGLTDMLDGFFARRAAGPDPSHAGDWLDPMFDRIFVVSAGVYAFVTFEPPAMVLFLLTRDVLQTLLMGVMFFARRDLARRYPYRAELAGKITTGAQVAALVAVAVAPPLTLPLVAVAALVGLSSVGMHARKAVRLLREGPAEGSPPR